MALLKKQSYLLLHPNHTILDWEIYLLKSRPLNASESKEERDVEIQKLVDKDEKSNHYSIPRRGKCLSEGSP